MVSGISSKTVLTFQAALDQVNRGHLLHQAFHFPRHQVSPRVRIRWQLRQMKVANFHDSLQLSQCNSFHESRSENSYGINWK